eukprot:g11473.t1
MTASVGIKRLSDQLADVIGSPGPSVTLCEMIPPRPVDLAAVSDEKRKSRPGVFVAATTGTVYGADHAKVSQKGIFCGC